MDRQVSRGVQKLGIISVILIVVASSALFFYFQNKTEDNIENSLFDKQKQRQLEATKTISQHIGSDLDSAMTRLQGLANSAALQNPSSWNGNSAKKLIEDNYRQVNSTIDKLFVLDKNNMVKINLVPPGQKNFLGSNVSYLSTYTA